MITLISFSKGEFVAGILSRKGKYSNAMKVDKKWKGIPIQYQQPFPMKKGVAELGNRLWLLFASNG